MFFTFAGRYLSVLLYPTKMNKQLSWQTSHQLSYQEVDLKWFTAGRRKIFHLKLNFNYDTLLWQDVLYPSWSRPWWRPGMRWWTCRCSPEWRPPDASGTSYSSLPWNPFPSPSWAPAWKSSYMRCYFTLYNFILLFFCYSLSCLPDITLPLISPPSGFHDWGLTDDHL